jgi:hypothetical protein
MEVAEKGRRWKGKGEEGRGGSGSRRRERDIIALVLRFTSYANHPNLIQRSASLLYGMIDDVVKGHHA